MERPTKAEALAAELAPKAAEAFDPTPVCLAYAHGSRVLGTARPASDLDIGYYLDAELGFEGELSIAEEMKLADRLSELVGLEVDLRHLAPAPLEIRGRVLEEGVRIYSSDEVRRVSIERDLLARYHDQKETLRPLHEERLRSIAESGL